MMPLLMILLTAVPLIFYYEMKMKQQSQEMIQLLVNLEEMKIQVMLLKLKLMKEAGIELNEDWMEKEEI